MPFYRKPAKLEQVSSCLFVSKRAEILAVKIEPAPILAPLPVFGLIRMFPFGVAGGHVEHPGIKFLEDFFCHSRAKVVSPATNDWIHFCQECLDIGPSNRSPESLEFLTYF